MDQESADLLKVVLFMDRLTECRAASDMFVSLQFVVDGSVVGRLTPLVSGRNGRRRIQRFFDPAIIPVGDIRPLQPGGGSGFRLSRDGALCNRTTARELM